jgi:putative transposase
MTYWRLHYHLIWATIEREPSLTPEREKMFYAVLYRKGEELEFRIHAAGNMEEHVHVVLSIPPKIAVAEGVRHLKEQAILPSITCQGVNANSSGKVVTAL